MTAEDGQIGAQRPSLRNSLGWMAFAQGGSFAVQFASSVVVAHYLTPYETGIFAVAIAIAGVLGIIQALGLQALIVREATVTAELSATAFTVNTAVAVLLAGATALLSVAGASFLRDAGVERVLLVLAIVPLFGIVSFLPAAQLEREGRFREIALATAAATIAAAVVTSICAVTGFSFMSAAWGQVASGLVLAAGMTAAGRRHVRFRFGLAAWRRVADFAFQMVAVAGITSAATRLSDVIMGRLLGLGALGIYSRAASLNGLLWNNIHLVLGRVVLVDFAAIVRAGGSLRDRYIATVEITTALLWPAFAGLALLAGPLIRLLYGARWVPAAAPLAILAAASMVLVAITMTWELFAATGNLRAQTRIEGWRALAAIATFAAGCTWGLEAAAFARVLDAALAMLLYRGQINRMTGTTLADLLPGHLRSAGLTLAGCGPAALLMAMHRFHPDVPIVSLAATIALGVVLWGALLVRMRHPLGHGMMPGWVRSRTEAAG